VLQIVSPEGQPVSGAKIGTGLNVFENSQGHPPQTIVMWLRGQRRQWPFRSDAEGQVFLTGEYAVYRQFYALHEARGWVGYRALETSPADAPVKIQMEPACRVHVQLASKELEQLGHRLLETTAFIYDSKAHLMMYFVSERQHYEFLLPSGEYRLEVGGTGPNGARTQRLQQSLVVAPADREMDLAVLDLPATKLAALFGKPAPELAGSAVWVKGQPVSLERLRGRPVVLEFWGCWCAPCVQTMPKLMALYDEFDRFGVAFIAVHDNTVATSDALTARLAVLGSRSWGGKELPFHVALDAGEGRGVLHATYGVTQWPTTLLIGRDGRLVGEFSPWGELEGELRRMLGVPTTGGD
jgi:thiol-disulfide isomerase/thioredoxin